MNASANGANVSAKVVELAKDFMLVDYCGKIYRIDFDRYPYFRSCFLSELYNVQASAAGLHWPDADIDRMNLRNGWFRRGSAPLTQAKGSKRSDNGQP